jgi:hypothetical protein
LTVELLEDRTVLSSSSAAATTYRHLPLAFELNQGQAPAGINYVAQSGHYSLDLTAQAAVLHLGQQPGSEVLTLGLAGANPAAPAVGLDRLITRTNYLIGNDRSHWHTNIPNFGRVEYQNVYPGIDVAYYGNQGRLEYDFVVAAGADAGVIRLAIGGSRGLAVDAAGDLVLHTAGADLVEQAPVVYQIENGVRQPVAGRFLLLPAAGTTNEVGLQLGAYDHARPLVIDPVLDYGPTALPGRGLAIAVDSSGNAYVTGQGSGGQGGFVGKLNPAGTAFVYVTYLGIGWGDAIAVDGAGDAYITGVPGSGFATTANAFSTTASSLFVTKLDPTGSNLLYSTYVPGGNANDPYGLPGGIAVDVSGNIYVTGAADAGFSITPSAYQPSLVGGQNAFLAEFNPSQSGAASLVYGSYLGGGQGIGDEGTGIALDGAGNVYISGVTWSANFPTTPGAFQTVSGGNEDAFVAKFDTSLSGAASLVYSTYLGGNSKDGFAGTPLSANPFNPGPGIAVDSAGEAYIAGGTSSTNFPTTPGAFQTALASDGVHTPCEAFVTKLNAAGSGLVYSTYLGGSTGTGSGIGFVPGQDCANGIALDAYGNATITGWTSSNNLPTKNPIQASNAGYQDAFVTTLNASGSGLLFSTYLGGPNKDLGNGVALDASGNIYEVDATGTTVGTAYKISAPAGPSFGISAPAGTTAGNAFSINVTAFDGGGNVNPTYTGTVHFTSSDPLAVLPADYTFTSADSGVHTFSVTLKRSGAQTITATDTVTSAMVGSASVSVSPAAAVSLVISGPSSISAGTSFSITVTAYDPYGNVATGYLGTVHFSSTDSGARLPGNYMFTSADNGVHTFAGLKFKTRGYQTLTAVDTLFSSITGSLTTDVM